MSTRSAFATLAQEHPALLVGLEATVPLWIDQLLRLAGVTRNTTIQQWASSAVEPIGSRGDALLFGGKRGQAADVFNHLARGLAALAMAPGGVLFAGVHWCVEHRGGLPTESTVDLTCGASGWASEVISA